jgi:hypothetical protein
MSFGNTVTALSALTVTQNTLFPCSEASARNEITAANLLAGLGIFFGTSQAAAYPSSGWLATWNAGTIAGNDGDTVTSWEGGLTATASTTAPVLKKAANGINGLPVVRFSSGKYMQTATGGASLTGDWYVAAVVRPTSVGAYEWFVMWGDEADGKRRGTGFDNSNQWGFNGYNADVITRYPAAASTAYFVEAQSSGGTVTVWVNGVVAKSGAPALVAFASAVVTIGANNAGTENWLGDVARLYIKASVPTAAEVSALRNAVAADYGIGVWQAYSNLYASQIRASSSGSNPEHSLRAFGQVSGGTGLNVLRLQQVNPTGFSCVYGCGHDVADGVEGYGFAVGWGNSGNTQAFGGRGYFEVYNALSTTFYPYAVIQTNSAGIYRRYEATAAGSIVEYSRSAVYPNEGQVSVRGLAPTATANAAVLTTVIATPAYGVLVVRDNSNAKVALYRLESTTLTAIGTLDAQWTTTKDTGSKVNVYAESNVIKVQNNSGGSLNLTAALYGA